MAGPCRRRAAALALAALAAGPAHGWLTSGHRRATIDAVGRLPDEVPRFFRDGAAWVGHAAVDPDLWRNRDTPELADREAPEHYLDLELLRGAPLPARRADYLRLLARLHVEPQRAGALPYAIVEGAERLALAFAEHRRWPADEAIRAKCLLEAGWLAHYAGDLTQPLHTTIHHDGRAKADGESPYSGLHRLVDGLFARLPRELALPAGETAAMPIDDDLAAAVAAELTASHALVETVYRLESRLRAEAVGDDRELTELARDRYRETVRFVGGVLWWSWRRSARIELPEWLAR